ncbi:hypothetical protein LshimejAT787_0205300 [Lyophyllum shimeji]|uniref:Uncharacterized protein n=1 Tax=Lyophyllum shimeji TaxID=47721 RepID=A0A9P3PFC4_LYOSH|nr:hypothetical protein LshimejAT787_0205300 [Lyophyllum shimeji]
MIVLFRPPGHPRASYQLPEPPADRVPSLSWICLQRLVHFVDELHHLPVRLNYLPDRSDVLHGTQPLDPRLWATLVQVYDNLSHRFRALEIPLADPHLIRLQRIPHTPRFSLLTILDLPACPHLTDTSIVSLSPLHSLVALDASATSLTAYGIKALAGTLLWVDDGPDRRGPWPLRILRLRYCVDMDDDVYPHLAKFPLLSVVDLRGTDCRPSKSSEFQPSSETVLFHPSPLAAAVDSLSGRDLYSSPNTFNLVIGTLHHPLSKDASSIVIPQESYVFVPPSRAKRESPKDASLSDYHLQPPAKRRVVPKDLVSQEGDVSRYYDCESDDHSCNAPECYDFCDCGDFFGNNPSSEHDGSNEDDSEDEYPQMIETPDWPMQIQPDESPSHTRLEAPSPPLRASVSDPPAYLSESTPHLFYYAPVSLIAPPKYDPEKNYSAQMYYDRVHFESFVRPSSRHDAKLALCRTPPPWSALEEHSAHLRELAQARPRCASGNKADLGVAVVDRRPHAGIQMAQARINALRESAMARRRSAGGAGQARTPGSEAPASLQGRNPFRRQSASAALEGSNLGIRPLKPISAVEVPLLPDEAKPRFQVQKRPAATPGARTSKIKFSGLESSSFAGNIQSAATSQLKRPTVTSAVWAGAEDVERKRSSSDVGKAVSVKKIKVGDPPVFGGPTKARESTKPADGRKHNATGIGTGNKRSDKGKACNGAMQSVSRGKAGFDWGAWSGGGKEKNR